jgi:hypothetical protein
VGDRQPLPGEAGRVAGGDAEADGSLVSVAAAFQNRRSQIVAVQKVGKGPWSASIICAEAVGPVVFCGFAVGGERTGARIRLLLRLGVRIRPGRADGAPWVRP